MINDDLKRLYWHTNAWNMLGYAPGELLIVHHQAGGGFAGAPQVLELGLTSGIARNQPLPKQAEFPTPSSDVQYIVGGSNFGGYHYHNPHVGKD